MAKDTLDAPLDDGRILPAHIEDTIRAIAKLHADHERSATPMQRVVESLTGLLARPSFVAVVTLAVVAWIGANLGLRAPGHVPFDPPPFTWLQGLLALGAVYMAGLILGTQRRADLLASHREQLTLELAILAEQKTAKTIALLEELRRDLPMLHNPSRRLRSMRTPPRPPPSGGVSGARTRRWFCCRAQIFAMHELILAVIYSFPSDRAATSQATFVRTAAEREKTQVQSR
jgi:uncharacterized membrane protein